jgi:DNA-binding NtrC family response regulator
MERIMSEQSTTALKPKTRDRFPVDDYPLTVGSSGRVLQEHIVKLLGESPAIRTLRSLVEQFADTPFPVLIEGETGSGKELVAKGLHTKSPRANAPFLAINCASFCPELLDAQLFGHSKGAFTGATSGRAGFFEAAGNGSLFLDEIGDMHLGLQSKLLRVLENGEYYRLGETRTRISRARIIASTNRHLKQSVRSGEFRQDLYHRLGVLTINVPPLRERGEDCQLLLDHFRLKYFTTCGPFALDDEARRLLREYSFPGNVRELRNLAIRLGAKFPGTTVSAGELSAELECHFITAGNISDARLHDQVQREFLMGNFQLDSALREYEKRYINAALEISRGNLSRAARLLGINRTTLYSRLARLSIAKPI